MVLLGCGIEITSNGPKETETVRGALHIIGLFVDPTNTELLIHCKKAQRARIERADTIIQNLEGIGFIVPREEVFAAAAGDAVGLPHIVRTVLAHSENQTRIDALMEEFRRDAEHDEKLAVLYAETIRSGPAQHIYKLFFSRPSYRTDIKCPIAYKVDLDESVRLIRAAGGVATIAHYGMDNVRDLVPRELLVELLTKKRLDGIETRYGRIAGGLSRAQEEERIELQKIVLQTGAIATGGADAHTEEDYRDFATDRSFSGETIGMAARVVKQTGVSTRWSSL